MMPEQLGGSGLDQEHGFHAVVTVKKILVLTKGSLDLAQITEIFQHDLYHARKQLPVAS